MGSGNKVQTRGVSKSDKRPVNDPLSGLFVTGALRALVTRIKKLERMVSEEEGDFDLFALLLRENSSDRWDLVIAAKWIGNDTKKTLDLMAAKLVSIVRMPALLMISRIVPLTQQDPIVPEIQDAIHVEHGLYEVNNVELGGVSIQKGFIITSRRGARNGRLPARR